MAAHRFFPLLSAVAAALLTGCVTVTDAPRRPKVIDAEPATAASAAPASTDDPLPPGLSPKFVAFITHQGLAHTPAQLGQPARLTAAWNNKIVYAPDPTHGGDPVPGLMARIYVFGPDEAVPLEPDGELIVGVWDMAPKAAGRSPELMELWHIDRETAAKFRRPDFLGAGYSLFLPWSKYHVDLKQVNVVARFNAADGRSLVSSPETLSIDHSATLQRAAERLGVRADVGRDPVAPAGGPPAAGVK